MKIISIIIPCYNGIDFIRRCVHSIIEQTFGLANVEIIMVDDNSTDNTWDLLLELEKEYPDNIIAIHSDVNGRHGSACNIGLTYASCEWVSFIDQDDWIEKDYLDKLYKQGEENDCDIVCCRFKRDTSSEYRSFDEIRTGKDNRLLVLDDDEKIKSVSVYNDISSYCWGKLIKRSFLLDNNLFLSEGVVYEDNLWGELLPFYAKRVYFLEEYLYHYYINSNSTVLSMESNYHLDLITVHIRFLKECEIRGLYRDYKDEIEYNILYNCFLSFMKILAYRYKDPNYSHFLLLKEVVGAIVPDWKDNKYIAMGVVKDFHKILFELIDKEIDRQSFYKVLELIRKHGL